MSWYSKKQFFFSSLKAKRRRRHILLSSADLHNRSQSEKSFLELRSLINDNK